MTGLGCPTGGDVLEASYAKWKSAASCGCSRPAGRTLRRGPPPRMTDETAGSSDGDVLTSRPSAWPLSATRAMSEALPWTTTDHAVVLSTLRPRLLAEAATEARTPAGGSLPAVRNTRVADVEPVMRVGLTDGAAIEGFARPQVSVAAVPSAASTRTR